MLQPKPISPNKVLRAVRVSCGMTQQEFAEFIHTTRVTVANFESEGEPIRNRALEYYADAFEVDVNTIKELAFAFEGKEVTYPEVLEKVLKTVHKLN